MTFMPIYVSGNDGCTVYLSYAMAPTTYISIGLQCVDIEQRAGCRRFSMSAQLGWDLESDRMISPLQVLFSSRLKSYPTFRPFSL
jgi:hypothetical protein